MDDESNTLTGLQNICSYCDKISDLVRRFGSEDVFMEDNMYLDACAYSLFVIGEIVGRDYNRLIRESPDFPWSDFARLGDLSLYEHRKADYAAIWNTVTADVPRMREEASAILERHGCAVTES